MEQLLKAIQKLESLNANIAIHGNSAHSIMKEIGFFLQYDLGETIDLLKTAELEMKNDLGGGRSRE